ncbi:MAG: hypothetical protein ACI8QZ_000851 [Chlamydiales bacterium]|jgi:hypothetical protein
MASRRRAKSPWDERSIVFWCFHGGFGAILMCFAPLAIPYMNTTALLLGLSLAGSIPGRAPAPRLVVLVSVDQLIPEQLERLAPWLDGGLGRFHRTGRTFRAAELGYARTETGPGHVTLSTGTYPSTHGVVGNGFFDRERRHMVYCVGDDSVAPLTSDGVQGVPVGGGDMSPRSIRVPGLGDYMVAASGDSKVVSIAGKDRAAVGMGGQEADVAIWWDRAAGGFRSSTYYADALPDWVLEWNGTWPDRYQDFAAQGWQPLRSEYPGSGTAADDRKGEMAGFFRRRVFPYGMPGIDSVSDAAALARAAAVTFSTPLVDEFVLSMASVAIEQFDLGADAAPDLLAIGLSACDITGHSFGPYSREVTDVLMRADDGLGELFDLLDERLGSDGWIACLSADHGILDLPEGLRERGIDSDRIPQAEVVGLRERVVGRFGEAFGSDLGFDYTGGLVFDEQQIQERDLDPLGVWDLAAHVALETEWIVRAYTFAELRETDVQSGAPAADPLRRLMARSVAEGRGPDVSLVRRPWTLLAVPTGTSHGSPYAYDRRIPLVFMGPGFAPGTSHEPVGAVDAAPTLLDALGIEVPERMDGRALPRE